MDCTVLIGYCNSKWNCCWDKSICCAINGNQNYSSRQCITKDCLREECYRLNSSKPHKRLILLAYSHGRTLMYSVAEAFKEYSSADDDSSAVHTWSPLYWARRGLYCKVTFVSKPEVTGSLTMISPPTDAIISCQNLAWLLHV